MEQKVTAITTQKKNANRVNIYLDGEFAFGLSRITAAWLSVGQDLSEEKISSLQHQDAIEVAMQKALAQISYRPRSESEIHKKLLDAGIKPEIITITIERLRESGLVQDERFARAWIDSRSNSRPRSHRFLAYELRQKGLQDEVIETALTDTIDDDQLAYQAASRYAARLDGTDWNEFRKRLSDFLGRRGFSYGTINPVVKQIWQERSPEAISSTNLDNEDDRDG